MMTSSPSFIPNHFNIITAPEVQEFTQTAALDLVKRITSISSAITFGPEVIQPDFSVSITSLITFWSINGGENEMFMILELS